MAENAVKRTGVIGLGAMGLQMARHMVAKGFDVDFRAAIVPSLAVALAYFIPCVLLGYFALKLRELESK